MNGNKLSKLFEPPTGLEAGREGGEEKGGGMLQLLKRRVDCDCQSSDGREDGGGGRGGSVNRQYVG